MVHHADWKLSRLRWLGNSRQRNFGGKGAEDYAYEAMAIVIEGTRSYDPQSEPDFLKYLRGVVDSLISHAVDSAENKKSRRMPHDESSEGDSFEDSRPGREADPVAACAEPEAGQFALEMIRRSVKDDKVVSGILDCLEAEITQPSEMAEMLGVDVERIYDAKKRLRRMAEKALGRERSK